MNDREKGICPSVKFAMKVFIPKRPKMSENVNAAKAWQERLSLKRQKTAQSRNGEFVYGFMLITMSNRVTLYGEQHLLNSVTFHIIEKNHAKLQNRQCQV